MGTPTTAPAAFPAAPARQRSLTLPGSPRAVARARAFVADFLGPGHPRADVAVLLTSELVTNAVLHSDSRANAGTVTVVVRPLGDRLRVEVSDAGSAHSFPVVKREVAVSHGHGLLLVDSLAQEWGYSAGATGTTVWFSLAA